MKEAPKDPRKRALAVARDGKTVVTFGEVLDLLPEKFSHKDVKKALEALDVPLWPEGIEPRGIKAFVSFTNPLNFTVNANLWGLIKRAGPWGFEKVPPEER